MTELSDSAYMRALSIRQPFAEMILRGLKTVEYRSRSTRIIGERFLIYAARGPGNWRNECSDARQSILSLGKDHSGSGIRSDNIVVPATPPPPWMIELANAMKLFPEDLPTGLIVGSAVIDRVTEPQRAGGYFQWHLRDVQRTDQLQKPARHPQPAWFNPF